MVLLPYGPEPYASANSAIPARQIEVYRNSFRLSTHFCDFRQLLHQIFIVFFPMGQDALTAVLHPAVGISVISPAVPAQAIEGAETEQAVHLFRLHGMAGIVFTFPMVEKSVVLAHAASFWTNIPDRQKTAIPCLPGYRRFLQKESAGKET